MVQNDRELDHNEMETIKDKEVRKLAENAAVATKEIARLIQEVQGAVAEAVGAIEVDRSLLEVSAPYLSPDLESAADEFSETSLALDEASLKKQFQEMAAFTFPATVQIRLNGLMEKNNEGELTPDECEELRALVELNELVSILKGQARLLLHFAQQ